MLWGELQAESAWVADWKVPEIDVLRVPDGCLMMTALDQTPEPCHYGVHARIHYHCGWRGLQQCTLDDRQSSLILVYPDRPVTLQTSSAYQGKEGLLQSLQMDPVIPRPRDDSGQAALSMPKQQGRHVMNMLGPSRGLAPRVAILVLHAQ